MSTRKKMSSQRMGDEKDSVGLKLRLRSRGSKTHRHTEPCFISLTSRIRVQQRDHSISTPVLSHLISSMCMAPHSHHECVIVC